MIAPGALPALIEANLRGLPVPRLTAGRLAVLIVVCGAFYGFVMGSYAGFESDRVGQLFTSALKVPFLLLATVALSLPSFFVLNVLGGVGADFRAALRAILSAQATLTITLASLAPVTVFWYVSIRSYRGAILFNAFMFALASVAAQARLRADYAPLIARHPVHRQLLRLWLGLFALVGIQMGWVLRPFIGDPSGPFQFFRPNAWGNAYLIVGRMILEQLQGAPQPPL